jgi:hypothetical protein
MGPIQSWSDNLTKCVLCKELNKPTALMNCVIEGNVLSTNVNKTVKSEIPTLLFEKTDGVNTGGFLKIVFNLPSSNNGEAVLKRIVIKTNNLVFTLYNARKFSNNVTWTPTPINKTHNRTGYANDWKPGKSYTENIMISNYWYYKDLDDDYVSCSGSLTLEICVGPNTTLAPAAGNGTIPYTTGILNGSSVKIYKITVSSPKIVFNKLQYTNGQEYKYRLIQS